MTAPIAQEMPYGFTGLGGIAADGVTLEMVLNQTFAQAVNNYAIRAPITKRFKGFEGSCTRTVKAAGLNVNCTEESIPRTNNGTVVVNGTVIGNILNGSVFQTSFS